jgi:hypothetical protein
MKACRGTRRGPIPPRTSDPLPPPNSLFDRSTNDPWLDVGLDVDFDRYNTSIYLCLRCTASFLSDV